MPFDLPDWTTISSLDGANIILDKLTQGAFTQRSFSLRNDNGVTAPTAPPAYATAQTYWGKYFPRGCRGMLASISIYCKGNASELIVICYTPIPGMGEIGEVEITPGNDWGWVTATVRIPWNYDSMFLWISICEANCKYGYDTTAPLDQFISADSGVKWYLGTNRLFIYATMEGATVGDIPVSGTINSIPIPSSAAQEESGITPVGATAVEIADIEGSGYCELIQVEVQADPNSDHTLVYVYTDDVMAYRRTFDQLYNAGYTASTPGVSLLKHAVDGACVMLLTTRFEFRRKLSIQALNVLSSVDVLAYFSANVVK